MNKMIHSVLAALAILSSLANLSACGKNIQPEEKPSEETPLKPEGTIPYPNRQLYSNALFKFSDVPHKETASDIVFREARLSGRIPAFYADLDNAIASGTVAAWLDKYHKEFTSETYSPEPYTILIQEVMKQERYRTALKEPIVAWLRANIPLNLDIYRQERANDVAAARNGGLIFDLNTVHPVRYMLESAYALRLLGEYDKDSEDMVTAFIAETIENKVNYYTGTYRTSGYNKEIFAMDVAFWVKMLYGDRYPCTNLGFEGIWENVTVTSYDGDNSPHYDAQTGFYLILRWGLLLGREDQMRASPHLHRIMDRMAKTVLTSGQCGKWGKSMENLYSSNKELAVDATHCLPWCLKVGYRLWGTPDYLYIARKYEDLHFNSLHVNRWWGMIVVLDPEGINYERVSARPTEEFGLVHQTERIATPSVHNGTMLGRGTTDYVVQADKIILSTGTHPDSPSLLIDMAISASKAAQDHRIGINMSLFKSAHVATYLGRPGEPYRINRPMVAPSTLQDFPIFPVAQGDVNPTTDYTNLLGYNYQTDYTLESHNAGILSEDAVWCEIAYSRFQYVGVSALRKLVLLHNGVIVVYDQLRNNGTMELNSASIYTLWPGVDAQGERWALQTPHIPTTVSTPSVSELPVLFCFPKTNTASAMHIGTDAMRTSYENGKTRTLYVQGESVLRNGATAEFITVIAPLKTAGAAASFADGIICEGVKEGYLLYLPSPEEKAIKILIPRDGIPAVE